MLVILSLVGWGVLAPAVVALVLSAGSRFFRKELVGSEGLIMGCAYSVAYTGLAGWPPFPPVEATQWLIFLLLVAGCLFWAEVRLVRGAVRWFLRLGFVLLSMGILLRPRAEVAWSSTETIGWFLGWCVALLSTWALLLPAADNTRRRWDVIPLLFAFAGSNIALLLAGSALLAQLGGAGATVFLVLFLFGPSGRKALSLSAVASVICLAIWLILLGYTYAYLPFMSASFLLASFLSVGVWRLPWLKQWRQERILALQLCAVLLMTGFALVSIPTPDMNPSGPW